MALLVTMVKEAKEDTKRWGRLLDGINGHMMRVVVAMELDKAGA